MSDIKKELGGKTFEEAIKILNEKLKKNAEMILAMNHSEKKAVPIDNNFGYGKCTDSTFEHLFEGEPVIIQAKNLSYLFPFYLTEKNLSFSLHYDGIKFLKVKYKNLDFGYNNTKRLLSQIVVDEDCEITWSKVKDLKLNEVEEYVENEKMQDHLREVATVKKEANDFLKKLKDAGISRKDFLELNRSFGWLDYDAQLIVEGNGSSKMTEECSCCIDDEGCILHGDGSNNE